MIMSAGYSNGIWPVNINLVEGLPVRNELFEVKNGVANVVSKRPLADGWLETAPMTSAQILGDCITRQFNMIRAACPDATAAMWSDMLDPNLNGKGGEPFASHRYPIGPGCPERFGQSAYPWFCAWQAWMMVVGQQWMAGVRPDYRHLIVDPSIPEKWKRLTVTRTWRGATYEIEIRNPNGVSSGVAELVFDGRRLKGNGVPAPQEPGERHTVVAILG